MGCVGGMTTVSESARLVSFAFWLLTTLTGLSEQARVEVPDPSRPSSHCQTPSIPLSMDDSNGFPRARRWCNVHENNRPRMRSEIPTTNNIHNVDMCRETRASVQHTDKKLSAPVAALASRKKSKTRARGWKHTLRSGRLPDLRRRQQHGLASVGYQPAAHLQHCSEPALAQSDGTRKPLPIGCVVVVGTWYDVGLLLLSEWW